MTDFDRLIRTADRLAKVKAGSAVAGRTIHGSLGRLGPVPPYTTDEAVARSLLPPGFEWMATIHAAG